MGKFMINNRTDAWKTDVNLWEGSYEANHIVSVRLPDSWSKVMLINLIFAVYIAFSKNDMCGKTV